MLITLAVVVICALLAARRRRAWWTWGLIGAAIDVGVLLLLLFVGAQLGLHVRATTPTTPDKVFVWSLLIVPHLSALGAVYALTRSSVGTASTRSATNRRRKT